jgi:hypothetical protein
MRFLELFRHMVGLLGRVFSPSQGLYLHRTTQHRKTRDIHPCLERDSNPRSQQPTGQDPRLRPHGHCDRQQLNIVTFKFILFTVLAIRSVPVNVYSRCSLLEIPATIFLQIFGSEQTHWKWIYTKT